MRMRMLPKISTLDVKTSLKAKLVLSYLLVILGTVLVLSFAVSVAVQNYFHGLQVDSISDSAKNESMQILNAYRFGGGWQNISWGNRNNIPSNDTPMLFVVDANGASQFCSNSLHMNCDTPDATVTQTLKATIQDHTQRSGDITLSVQDHSISFVYVSMPLIYGDQNQPIGALFLAQPRFQFSPEHDVLQQINQSILIAGLAVAVIAALCSYLFVQRFVRPLELLTTAAEQMKQGQYTQRVDQPMSQDEVGRLAQTFNEMANTIEADVNELHRQDEMRRDLIANIAHDLATPLTAIQGLSEALADDVISEPEARQETAQRIGREVQRLRRLVADVRQMTMIEAGQIPLDLAPLDLSSLVDETVAVIEPEYEAMGITMQNTLSHTFPEVQADSDRITQVLLNLLDNARRHTNTGGTIHIGATVQDTAIHISIQDTGIGIDPADLPHIFERFYRADRSRAAKTGGSGLGLAIVKAIVAAHGGRVWAESTRGQGTRVTFTLPLVREVSYQHTPSPHHTQHV